MKKTKISYESFLIALACSCIFFGLGTLCGLGLSEYKNENIDSYKVKQIYNMGYQDGMKNINCPCYFSGDTLFIVNKTIKK